MNKSRNFSGHPIIKQVLNFILPQDVYRTAKKHQSDRYTKKFTTYEHLATMIFTVISGCSSLREVSNIMLACEGKINHIGLKDFPRRSTLSDANKRRSAGVFAAIYNLLYKRYHLFLSDSRPSEPAVKGLKIVDSSTITLFSDILKGVGRNPLNGKKKGGIKMHIKVEFTAANPISSSAAKSWERIWKPPLGFLSSSCGYFEKLEQRTLPFYDPCRF